MMAHMQSAHNINVGGDQSTNYGREESIKPPMMDVDLDLSGWRHWNQL